MEELTLSEKISLLTGADAFTLRGLPRIGLRALRTSDGPAGVRGTSMDPHDRSTSFPAPIALAATWDAALVERLATELGREARAKGIDVLLAPTVNLARTPYGGRGFECFGEDPWLAGRIAAAYVRGVQSEGVATVKHFVGNDSEVERWTVDVRADEATLREVYLAPFEACVRGGELRGRDGRVQPRQRHVHDRARTAARSAAEAGVGLSGHGLLRLVRRALDGRDGVGRPRSGDAGPGRSLGPGPGGRGAGRAGTRIIDRRQGGAATQAGRALRSPRRSRRPGTRGAGQAGAARRAECGPARGGIAFVHLAAQR